MTQAKAQEVISSLIGLGYVVTIQKLDADNWVATVPNAAVTATEAAQFAIDHSVTAKVTLVELS